MNVLRPSLLPGLLTAMRHNLNHRINDIALFEIGRVFVKNASAAPKVPGKDGGSALTEERRVAIALTGKRNALFWTGEDRDALFDIYDLKGLVEEFFEQFNARGITYSRRTAPEGLFIESAVIQLGKFPLGRMGLLLPTLARQFDLRDPVLLAEVNLDVLLARRNPSKSFKTIPALPSIRRDVAMVVPENTSHEAVLQVVKQAKPANLESVELFDVFRGKHVPAGQKSLAYAFTYRSAEKNLTDAEVNSSHEKLVAQFKQSLQAAIRD
jgi:phenylalanyl-tRNA synthetase beta chain